MSNEFYVYEWVRLDTNEVFYVGKGKGNRCFNLTRGNNKHFNNIVKKVEVAVVILEKNLDEKTAYEYEIYYINHYNEIGCNLVNITNGGSNPILYGEKNGNYNNRWSEEQRKHLSRVRKEMFKSGMLIPPNKGKKFSEEYRRKIKENHVCMKGDKNPFYGKTHSIETKNKISEFRKGKYKGKDNNSAKRVICLTTGKVFETMKEAGIFYNICWTSICNNCRGKQKTAGKLEDGTRLVWQKI